MGPLSPLPSGCSDPSSDLHAPPNPSSDSDFSCALPNIPSDQDPSTRAEFPIRRRLTTKTIITSHIASSLKARKRQEATQGATPPKGQSSRLATPAIPARDHLPRPQSPNHNGEAKKHITSPPGDLEFPQKARRQLNFPLTPPPPPTLRHPYPEPPEIPSRPAAISPIHATLTIPATPHPTLTQTSPHAG